MIRMRGRDLGKCSRRRGIRCFNSMLRLWRRLIVLFWSTLIYLFLITRVLWILGMYASTAIWSFHWKFSWLRKCYFFTKVLPCSIGEVSLSTPALEAANKASSNVLFRSMSLMPFLKNNFQSWEKPKRLETKIKIKMNPSLRKREDKSNRRKPR